MVERKKPHVSYVVSLCGIMSGLSLVMMFFLSMIPSFEYVSPIVSGLLLWVVAERLGTRYGLISYMAVGLLCLFISPNYEASMMFIFIFGYYPIIRQYIMKLPHFLLKWLVKLVLYAAAAIACYWLLINLFNMTHLLEDMGEMGEYGAWILLAMGAVAFILYDIFLGLFAPFYDKMLKPKIARMMK
ncbi:MAG: hypothetical protein J6A16_01315 [Oscillospiraceae bacterium]|nr:hypothetical protein [Oscillospiraceae bacterium]